MSILSCIAPPLAVAVIVLPATPQNPSPFVGPDRCCIMVFEEMPETLICNAFDCYPPGQQGCYAQGREAESFLIGGTCKYAPEEVCKLVWTTTQLDKYRCVVSFEDCDAPLRRCSWEYNSAGALKGHYTCAADSSICGLP